MEPMAVALDGQGVATDYAAALLRTLGFEPRMRPGSSDPHPAHAWARSGAMALTGKANGMPQLVPGPLASAANGALRALRALAPHARLASDGAALLGERAAVAGLTRQGTISPGGQCRLLRTADGWLAVQLARDEDRDSLPAWLETPLEGANWDALAAALATRARGPLLERARWLGLPVADAAPSTPPESWLRFVPSGADEPTHRVPRVLDLSGLWAGPLAGALLADAGADVVKVESTRRPDGARQGPMPFFDRMNGRKSSVALDFASPEGQNALRRLIAASDIVIESARPRALAQLGIDAEAVCQRAPLLWVSLTGYGRRDPPPGRVAFGDDAGVAAGLSEALGRAAETPLFCGDAIADPLTGLHAALAAWALFRRGARGLVDLSLRDVVAHTLHFAPGCTDGARVVGEPDAARVVVGTVEELVAAPRARPSQRPAPALGRDTQSVMAALDAC